GFWGIGNQAPTVAPETNGPSVQSPTPVGARVDHETADEGVERRAVVAAAPAPTPTTGSLLVRATHRDDGSPVPELLIFVWRPGADRRIDVHRTRTDVAGEVRLTDLRPGRLLVSNSRNPYCFGRAEIVAGEEIEVGLALPVGVTITGIVVDSSDVPVAGAEVCLGGGGSREDAEGAAITGADGRFALRGCQTDFYIGARAAGYTSSVMQFVQLEEGDQRELRLLLPGAGGSVAGVVRGPTGEPVADALLAIGEAAFGRQDTTTGRALRALVRTDAEGRYRAVGVAPGEQAVRVRAAEFAPWQGTCRVDAGLTTSFDITLGAAMTVAGTVLDESGAPVGQATITIEGIDDFGHQRLESGTDGTFSIGGLQPGPVELTARHEEAGKAFLRVRGNPGQTVRCELRLDRGRVFRGRVFDEAGKPVAGVFVEAAEQIVDANEAWGGFAQSDAEGRFAIPSHPEGAQLTVTATAEGFSPFGIRDVEPERGELDIRLRAAPPKSAYLSGSVLMPDGNPAPMAELFAEAKAGGTSGTVLAQESGEFSIGPLRPGTWSLVVRVADQPTLWTGWCELPAAGTVDLGQLRLPVAGSIRVRLHGADGLEPTLAVSDPTLSHWTGLEREGDGRRSEPLVPGPHFVHVGGNGVSTRLVAVDVRAGEVSELDIELQRGRRQRFELIAPVRLDERNYRILRDGALVSGESFSTRRPGTLDPKFSCWLAPGDYTITATAHGMSGQARFAVGAGDGAPVRVFLR
ncbi:MAG: carboxypeptidase regulatory-like domain-containing protein, partial [Planctomycetes bacterium]|nr:carboxypeptidase regulatory-like domain-containing protein [Planctomycetota bacterium]